VGRAQPPGGPRRARVRSVAGPLSRPGVLPEEWADDFVDEQVAAPGRQEPQDTADGGYQLPPGGAALLTRFIGLGRAHVGAIVLVLVVALIFTATRVMAAKGHDVQDTPLTPALTPVVAQSTASPTEADTPIEMMVHVLGAVATPGVVVLSPGARVADAIGAAGGLSQDADCAELNLAAPVSDGDQVVVGTRSAPRGEVRRAGEPTTVPASGSGSQGAGSTLDLNTATADQLDGLPGVGPVTAQRILAWRDQHGRFTRVEELQEVDGIGEKTYAQLAPLVRV